MDAQLQKAMDIVEKLQGRVELAETAVDLGVVAEVSWTPYTLAISIAGYCVWDDQGNNDEELTFEFCWNRFTEWRDALARI